MRHHDANSDHPGRAQLEVAIQPQAVRPLDDAALFLDTDAAAPVEDLSTVAGLTFAARATSAAVVLRLNSSLTSTLFGHSIP
jgi:hypothetical protein